MNRNQDMYAGHVPGPSDAVARYPRPMRAPRRLSRMALWATLFSVGVVFVGMCLILTVASLFTQDTGPGPDPQPPAAQVEVSGTCQKRIIGSYGMVASVTALNATNAEATGTIWVRWPITGAEPISFTKKVTLPPGATVDFYVDEPINGEKWLRLGECDYGWTQQ